MDRVRNEMAKQRISWGIWLMAVLVLHIFLNTSVSLSILLLSICLPLIGGIFAAVSAKQITISVSFPEQCAKQETLTGTLSCHGSIRFFPIRIVCTLEICNQMTNERSTCHVESFPDRETTFSLPPQHCGNYLVSIQHAGVCDPWCIFRARLRTEKRGRCLVKPDLFSLNVSLVHDLQTTADSEVYSTERPGFDPGETFGIREYVMGDPIKNIHWKMSLKANKYMVRELSQPMANQVLLLLESSILPAMDPPTAAEADALAEVLFSVSTRLVQLGIPHTIGWRDPSSELYQQRDVWSLESLNTVMQCVLSNTFANCEESVCSAFCRTHMVCIYAHVVVVSAHGVPDVDLLYHGNRITLLQLSDTCSSSGSAQLCLFTAANYAQDLKQIVL